MIAVCHPEPSWIESLLWSTFPSSSAMKPRVLDLCQPAPGNWPENAIEAFAHQWRDSFDASAILILSFLAWDKVKAKHPLLDDGVPGVHFVRLPALLSEIHQTVAAMKPLSEQERMHVCRRHTRLEQELTRLCHNIGNLLEDPLKEADGFTRQVSQLRASIETFAPEFSSKFQEFDLAKNSSDGSLKLQELQAVLRGDQVFARPEAPSTRAPKGCDLIGIADDSGYPESVVSALIELGYKVISPVARDLWSAQRLLNAAQPTVLLMDLHFPTKEDGKRLMELAAASDSVVVTVAISKKLLSDEEVTRQAANCTGADRAYDANEIHKAIWSKAQEVGITEHV